MPRSSKRPAAPAAVTESAATKRRRGRPATRSSATRTTATPADGVSPTSASNAAASAPPPPTTTAPSTTPACGWNVMADGVPPSTFTVPPTAATVQHGAVMPPTTIGESFNTPIFVSSVSASLAGMDSAPLHSVCDDLGAAVPLALQEKIWKGEFVEFGSLLRPARHSENDCVFMVGTHESPAWQLRPHKQTQRITSIEQWTSAFLIFASIFLQRHPGQARHLLKYADIVRSAAFRRTGFGWRDYDVNFRLRQARVPSRSWATIDAELWLMLVGAPGQPQNFRSFGSRGSYRQQDHSPNSFGSRRATQREPGSSTCHDFNRGQCFRPACRYAHKCAICSSVGHPASNCRGSRTRMPAVSANPNSAQ